MKQVLSIEHLTVQIRKGKQQYDALTDVSFSMQTGEIVGVVGESGCGKSMTALAVMGLLPKVATVKQGSIVLGDRDISKLSQKQLSRLRGKEMSMVFQEPMTALNPLMTVGNQIAEAYLVHHQATRSTAKEKALAMMHKVGLARAEELYNTFPHQLSGGMKQRVVIAIALINHPALIIADEPTTALDVTIQSQILRLLKQLNAEFGSSILFVSHDLGVVRETCDRVLVMYAGELVEQGNTKQVLALPQHPYTKGLLASLPTVDKRGQTLHTIDGMVASLEHRTHVGCSFATRCAFATERCHHQKPPLVEKNGHQVACFYTQEGLHDET